MSRSKVCDIGMNQPNPSAQPTTGTFRTTISMARSMREAARKRMIELGFSPLRGFAPYLQHLVRRDLAAEKK